jgi:two-component system sensor histidine kinase CpxA
METSLDEMKVSEVSLAELIGDVLPDVQYEAETKGCQIDFVVHESCIVRVNPDLLKSALENILRDAVRYSPEKGKVLVELKSLLQDRVEMAVMRVVDEGPGVPQDELLAILRPFYRVDRSRRATTGGFGVGLAIADRAVRLYGGNIRASSCEGSGLTVEVSVPISFAV